SHARNLEAKAWARYRQVQAHAAQWAANEPDGEEILAYYRVREGGPKTGVKWCVPVLPGVLLADSYKVIGPLNGSGGVKVVLYYGIDSVEVCTLYGWIS
ncbi:MAG TPA: hypothetical protein VGZ47_09475, partial [Gemmataceae bacterium]|nr:hypothetical protein [Gemmataceae bacterium]